MTALAPSESPILVGSWTNAGRDAFDVDALFASIITSSYTRAARVSRECHCSGRCYCSHYTLPVFWPIHIDTFSNGLCSVKTFES